jgi:tRNA pseudouridine65 synthase
MMNLTLLYRDDHLAAFAKPSGLLVHRGWGDDAITALDLARDAMGARVYPVHRLDRGTSGVLLFALHAESAAALQSAFERGDVDKTYLALVRGVPAVFERIDHPIPRRLGGPRVPAVTEVRRLFIADPGASDLSPEIRRASLVEARPRTGRLHQVRRHLKHRSHPIIGDANYGKGALNRRFQAEIGLCRLALHAAAIELSHPLTGAPLRFSADLPDDLRQPLSRLGIDSLTLVVAAAQRCVGDDP